MFGIGMSELIIILVVALLVFGPKKLPEIARSIAKGMRELRRAGDDLRASIDVDGEPAKRSAGQRAAYREARLDDSAARIPGSELSSGTSAEAAAPVEEAPAPTWPQAAEGTQAIGSLPAEPSGAAPADPSGAKEA